MKSVVLALFIIFVCGEAAIFADLFGLRLENNQPGNVVAIDLQSGFQNIVNLAEVASNFTSFYNLTYYDANSEIYIVGNTNPPMLALVNTFNGQTKVIKLPMYGQLLALTAYDGVAYGLLGLDEDVPNLGSIVAYDLKTGESERQAKFKISPAASFVTGRTLTWMPHLQAWLFDYKDQNGTMSVFLVGKSLSNSVLVPLPIAGGWNSVWFDVTTDNTTIITYKDGSVSKIDLNTYEMSILYNYSCPGILSVDFQKQQLQHYSNCDSPIIEIYSWYNNKTSPTVDLDPQLEDLVAVSSIGTYIPYLCGQACSVHPDCANSKTCNTCRDGRCSATGDCNAFCLIGKDCYAGVCVGNCENNRCGKRGCGNSCTNHDDCSAVSNECTVCRLGSCVSQGDCGSYCLTGLDCYAGACTQNCKNFRCAQN